MPIFSQGNRDCGDDIKVERKLWENDEQNIFILKSLVSYLKLEAGLIKSNLLQSRVIFIFMSSRISLVNLIVIDKYQSKRVAEGIIGRYCILLMTIVINKLNCTNCRYRLLTNRKGKEMEVSITSEPSFFIFLLVIKYNWSLKIKYVLTYGR